MKADAGLVGRPRSFDENAVIDQLVALFWRQGYAQTSMTDIVDASGVHKPSLYRTFGTKEQIFATVLRRYLDDRVSLFTQLVERCGPGIDGILEFLDLFEQDAINGTGSDGCLMVMASNELRGTIPDYENFAADYRTALDRQISTLVQRSLTDNVNADNVKQRTDLLSTYLLGLQVIIRSTSQPAEIKRSIDAIRNTVETWRTS